MKQYLAYFCLLLGPLFAEKGIVVTTNDKYANQYFISSLAHLRNELKCTLPIEVWHDGDELSSATIKKLKQFSNITVYDFRSVFRGSYGSLRGWHAKPFMLIATRFDEICLMDADAFFCDNPEKMFKHPKYIETGAFFFRDRWIPFPGVFGYPKYQSRREMYQRFIPKPSEYMPKVFLGMWEEGEPTAENPHLVDLQESGCIFLDKKRHLGGIANIIDLTKQRSYVYKCVHGDKETFWMGLEMAKEPYIFNDFIPCTVQSGGRANTMVHFVDGRLFYIQKLPIPISQEVVFFGVNDAREGWSRIAKLGEKNTLLRVYKSSQKYMKK